MKQKHNIERYLEKIVEWWMEDNTFEELLEKLNITPGEALVCLFEAGMIDEEELEQFVIDV